MTEENQREIQRRLHALVAAMPVHDQVPLSRWLHRLSRSGDPHDQGLIFLLLEGKARITEMTDDGPRVMLTAAGLSELTDLLSIDPTARALYAELSGLAVVPPPKREQ